MYFEKRGNVEIIVVVARQTAMFAIPSTKRNV